MLHLSTMVFQIEETLPKHYYYLLFMGTLLIYWFDHLQDSQNPLLVQPGQRHAWFKTKQQAIKACWTILFIAEAYLSIQCLNLHELLYGSILLLALFGYLFLHKKMKRIFILEKEILIAILYVAAVLFAIYMQLILTYNSYTFFAFFLLASILFFTCLQNLFSIAIIESNADENAQIKNITHSFGASRLQRLQAAMLLLQVFLSLLIYVIFPNPISQKACTMLFSISALNFLLPFLFPEPKNEVYRLIGDGIFILAFLI